MWKYLIRSGVQCQYYGKDGPDGSIRWTGLNESHLAAVCSSPNTFVPTRKRHVEKLARCCFAVFVAKDKRTKTSCELNDSSSEFNDLETCVEVILLVVMSETVKGQQRKALMLLTSMKDWKKRPHSSFSTGNIQWWRAQRCLGCFFFLLVTVNFTKRGSLHFPVKHWYLNRVKSFNWKTCFPPMVKSISTQTARSKRVCSVRLDPCGKFLSCCWIFTSAVSSIYSYLHARRRVDFKKKNKKNSFFQKSH